VCTKPCNPLNCRSALHVTTASVQRLRTPAASRAAIRHSAKGMPFARPLSTIMTNVLHRRQLHEIYEALHQQFALRYCTHS
jgi:hypothetical protein